MIGYADPSLNPTRAEKFAQMAGSFSSVIAWAFGAVLFLPVVGGALSLLFWQPFFGGTGAAFALVLLVVAGASVKRLRRKRSRIVLSYLLQAIQLQLPLPAMLRAAASGESRPVANRLDRMRIALEDGASVGNALLLAIPQTPRRIVDLANAGERNGCLARALRSVIDEPAMQHGGLEVPAFFQIYGLILLATVPGEIWFIDEFIMPRFQQIFQDFHLMLPDITQWMIGFGEVIAPLIAGVCLFAIMVSAGNAMRQVFSPARPRRNPLKTIIDHLIWPLPIIGSIAQDRGLADALGVAASALEAGRPADQAIREGAMPHLSGVLRNRIDAWAAGIDRGSQLHEAAAAAWMPSIVVGLLASGTRSGNLPAAMRFLARYYSLRFSRTATLVRGAAIPALVLGCGAIVLMTGLALFGPLISLIQSVSVPLRKW